MSTRASVRRGTLHASLGCPRTRIRGGVAERLVRLAAVLALVLCTARADAKWTTVPGGLVQISVGNSRHVWGVNRPGMIYRWTGRGWQRVSGGLRHVSAASDGTVWGVNAGGAVFRYVGPRKRGSPWQRMPGSMAMVSVGSARHVWAVDRSGGIHRWDGRAWKRVAGGLTWVSVGSDGAVWGVNRGGAVFRYAGPRGRRSPWDRQPGRIARIAVGNARSVWGVDPAGNVHRWEGRRWVGVPGKQHLVSSGADGSIWAVTAQGAISRWSAGAMMVVGKVLEAKVAPSRTAVAAKPQVARSAVPGGGSAEGSLQVSRPLPKSAKGWTKVQMQVAKKRYGAAAFGAILSGKQSIPTHTQVVSKTLQAFRSYGQLVPIAAVVKELKRQEDKGEEPPGSSLIHEYDQWQQTPTQVRERHPPGHLFHSKDGEKLFAEQYQGRILTDLQNYVPYIYDKVFLRVKGGISGAGAGPGELLFKYGCKQIARWMPGFAKVVKKRVTDEVDLVGDWFQPGSQMPAPKKPIRAGKGSPYQGKKKTRIVEICTVTHAQLGATLRKDLDLIVRATKKGRVGGRKDLIVPLYEILSSSSKSSYYADSKALSGFLKEASPEHRKRYATAMKRLWADMGKFNPDLRGESFFEIAKRLLSFYRRAGDARTFERAAGSIGSQVGKMAKSVQQAPEAKPEQSKGEVQAQAGAMPTRTKREVLRRRVEQWTSGYEYEQLSLRLLGATRPEWKFIRDEYLKAEGDLVRSFWNDCAELHELCEQPITSRERKECLRCAEQAVFYRCIEGKNEHGYCRGRHTVFVAKGKSGGAQSSPPNQNTLHNWIDLEARAEARNNAHLQGVTSVAALSAATIRDLVARKFFPFKVDPKEGKNKDGIRYVDALPITGWQRCVLLNPYYREAKDPNRCPDVEHVRALVKQNRGPVPWEKARLFAAVLEKPGLKKYLEFMMKTRYAPRCKGAACKPMFAKSRQSADKFFNRGQFAKEKGLDANGRLASAGSAISGALGPIVGKILGMLLKAAGMYETMKTLARASGLTPAQSADCEDPEYRKEVMHLAGNQDNKRGCLLKVFAKNFGSVLESIIVMLGNRLVDWGVDLLRAALQGLKSSLISAAGSVPFAGGFLAALVDIGWELLLNFGAKALLKGFVIAKLPKWLKIRELASLPFNALMAHPIVQVVAGIILQLIEAAMTYGEKSWMAVGVDSALRLLQESLRGSWFWYRALTYARKEMAQEASEDEALLPQLRRLGKAMIRGVVKVLARKLDPEWSNRLLGLVDKLEKAIEKLISSEGAFTGSPIQILERVLREDLGPIALPIVLSLMPIPDWIQESLKELASKIYAIVVDGVRPTGSEILKLVTQPMRKAVENLSFGSPLGKKIASGFVWAIENLGELKRRYLDNPWRIAQTVLDAVDLLVRQRADDLVERLGKVSSEFRDAKAQSSLRSLFSRGLNALARQFTQASAVPEGKRAGVAEMLLGLSAAVVKTSNDPLEPKEWTALTSKRGGLMLMFVVKELVATASGGGPFGELVRGLLDAVAILLESPGNLSGARVKAAAGKFLEGLYKAAKSFCHTVLLRPLSGTARKVAGALVDAGLGLIEKAVRGESLAKDAKSIVSKLISVLIEPLSSKAGPLKSVLAKALTGALARWK